MKKLAVICLLIAIIMSHIFAQDNVLYDVNYDEPLKTSNYDDSLAEFQKIYLQYEDAIKTTSTIIRQEERDTYNKELEKFKEEERIRTDTTIEKMRLAIYGNEVESVRKQETERLTAELTEKISADLNQELSAKYEKIKDDEIAKLYVDLKKQAYDETDATTQRVKSISSASAKIIIVILIIALIFIGIRAIISKTDIAPVFEVLRGESTEMPANWNRSPRENAEKLPGVVLDEEIGITADLEAAVSGKDVLVLAVHFLILSLVLRLLMVRLCLGVHVHLLRDLSYLMVSSFRLCLLRH